MAWWNIVRHFDKNGGGTHYLKGRVEKLKGFQVTSKWES